MQANFLQALERFISLHQGQAQPVGGVLLVDGELGKHRLAVIILGGQSKAVQPPVQVHQQQACPPGGVAPHSGDQVVIDNTFFTGRQAGNVAANARMLAKQASPTIVQEHAQRDIGDVDDVDDVDDIDNIGNVVDGISAVHDAVCKLLLLTNQIARRQKIENLASPVTERLATKRRSRVHGEELAARVIFTKAGASDEFQPAPLRRSAHQHTCAQPTDRCDYRPLRRCSGWRVLVACVDIAP